MNFAIRNGIRAGALALACTLAGAGTLCGTAHAQEMNPTDTPQTQEGIQNQGKPVGELNGVPLYRVNVVQRTLDAINYLHRKGSTKLDFRGTPLLPDAHGEAKVQSEKGRISVDATFHKLPPANGFGPEYLTYVLWAITPNGTPQNLGELLPDGDHVSIHVTTNLQAFGMIVTAEPYFAVRVPSNVVVMENHAIEDKTNGILEHVNARYTLLPRGAYTETSGAHDVFHPITRNEHSPLELYEAHNAYNIAALAGADKYAPDIMARVKQDITNADDIDASKHRDEKMEITYAREAVQSAEDARISTIRKKAQEDREREIAQRQQAQLQAAQSQQQAAESAAQAAQAQAATEREAAQRAQAEAAAANAQAAANRSAADAAAARQSVEVMREKLRAQLNSVLATKETARGLVVTLGDVLFDTGKSDLKEDAKISLAKVAVILQQYPDLKLQIEGYTDSVGGDNYNLKLSQDRADSTMAFLINNGVNPSNITAQGYGKADPVADNSTAAGRKQNRRVEMVVSGPSIGVPTQSGPGNTAPAPGSDQGGAQGHP